MTGRRIPDGEWFTTTLKPGDYGKVVMGDGRVQWFDWPPGADEPGALRRFDDANPTAPFHEVEEHEDGTITVRGSILHRGAVSQVRDGDPPLTHGDWHGWLRRGEWTRA